MHERRPDRNGPVLGDVSQIRAAAENLWDRGVLSEKTVL